MSALPSRHRYADRAEATDPGVVSANLRASGSPRSDDHRPPRGTGRVRIAFEHTRDEEPGDPEDRDGVTGAETRGVTGERSAPLASPRRWNSGCTPARLAPGV